MTKLFVVGAGTGNYEDFTIKAVKVLNFSKIIYCDEKMFKKIKDYFDVSKIISNQYINTRTRCINAINSANSGITTSIIGSGDTGIYGISSIIYNESEKLQAHIEIEIISGITSAISGSSLLGSPITKDFVVISLSDNLADKTIFQEKIEAVAKINFVIVFYSPCNPTKENLLIAREILLKYRSPETLVGITSHLGEESQSVIITTIDDILLQDVDEFSTIFVGNEETKTIKSKKMITPLY